MSATATATTAATTAATSSSSSSSSSTKQGFATVRLQGKWKTYWLRATRGSLAFYATFWVRESPALLHLYLSALAYSFGRVLARRYNAPILVELSLFLSLSLSIAISNSLCATIQAAEPVASIPLNAQVCLVSLSLSPSLLMNARHPMRFTVLIFDICLRTNELRQSLCLSFCVRVCVSARL